MVGLRGILADVTAKTPIIRQHIARWDTVPRADDGCHATSAEPDGFLTDHAE